LPFGANYNAGLVVKTKDGYSYAIQGEDDKVLMCFRNNIIPGYMLYSKTYMCELDVGCNRIKTRPEVIVSDRAYEDGRLFSLGGDLYTSISKQVGNHVQKQDVIRLRDGRISRSALNNVRGVMNTEKNWQFFEQGGKCYVIYSVMPFRIYELDRDNFDVRGVVVSRDWSKDGLKFRCSAPPVYVDGKYYMLVHSIYYRTYMITFTMDFRLISCTRDAICEAEECGYYVYFPCGLLYDRRSKEFIISMGVNNRMIAVQRVSKGEIDDDMESIK
jgi:hypothetical protein